MKRSPLFLTLCSLPLLVCSWELWAQDSPPSTSVNPATVFSPRSQSNDSGRLVEAIYQACAAHMPAAEEVANANDGTMQAFDACVQEELAGKSEQVLSMKAHLGRGNESLPQQKRLKSHQLLADYLEQRFEQKVRGKTSDSPGNRVINHSDFFHFYRSQLSKITTLVINSYCTKLDRDFSWNPPTTAQQKSDLLDLLKDPGQAKGFFTGCAGRITTVCHTPPKGQTPSNDNRPAKPWQLCAVSTGPLPETPRYSRPCPVKGTQKTATQSCATLA